MSCPHALGIADRGANLDGGAHPVDVGPGEKRMTALANSDVAHSA